MLYPLFQLLTALMINMPAHALPDWPQLESEIQTLMTQQKLQAAEQRLQDYLPHAGENLGSAAYLLGEIYYKLGHRSQSVQAFGLSERFFQQAYPHTNQAQNQWQAAIAKRRAVYFSMGYTAADMDWLQANSEQEWVLRHAIFPQLKASEKPSTPFPERTSKITWTVLEGGDARLKPQNQTGIYAELEGNCYQFDTSLRFVKTPDENCQRQKQRSPQGQIVELETTELEKPPGQSYTVAYDHLWIKDGHTGKILKQHTLSDAYNQLVGFNHAGHVLLTRTWSPDLEHWHAYPNAIAPSGEIARIHDVARLPNKQLAFATPRGVYLSNDTLTKTKLWGLSDQDVQQLAMLPNGTVLALSEKRLYLSSQSWKEVPLPTTVEIEGLGIVGKSLVVKTEQTLLHSGNQGKTWVSHPLPPNAKSWVVNQTQIWVQTPQGPHVSSNLGATWQVQKQGLVTSVQAVFASTTALYGALADNHYLYRFDEQARGQSLDQVAILPLPPLTTPAGDAIFYLPNTPMAGLIGPQSLTSTNLPPVDPPQSDNYRGLPPFIDAANLQPVKPDFYHLTRIGNALWLATANGLYRSEDQGKHWKAQALQGIRTTQLVTAPDIWWATTEQGLYASQDQGKTWQLKGCAGKTAGPITPLAQDGWLWVCEGQLFRESHTVPHGQQISKTPQAILQFWPQGQGVWAKTSQGLLYSADQGQTWQSVLEQAIADLYGNQSGEVWVALPHQADIPPEVLYSPDQGTNWQKIRLIPPINARLSGSYAYLPRFLPPEGQAVRVATPYGIAAIIPAKVP